MEQTSHSASEQQEPGGMQYTPQQIHPAAVSQQGESQAILPPA
jgi:hypothetical protein